MTRRQGSRNGRNFGGRDIRHGAQRNMRFMNKRDSDNKGNRVSNRRGGTNTREEVKDAW